VRPFINVYDYRMQKQSFSLVDYITKRHGKPSGPTGGMFTAAPDVGEASRAHRRAAEEDLTRRAREEGAKELGRLRAATEPGALREREQLEAAISRGKSRGAHATRVKELKMAEQLKRLPKGWRDLAKSVGKRSLIALGIGGGIAGAGALADYLHRKATSRRRFHGALKEAPELTKKYSPEDIKKRFKTLQRLSPETARDPILASSFLRQTMPLKDTGIQLPTVAAIAKARRDINEGSAAKRIHQMLLPGLTAGMKGD
jgi:hypothetical protein